MDRMIIALWAILADRMKTFRANACYLSDRERERMEKLVSCRWVPPEFALEFIKINPKSERATQKVIRDAATAAIILHMARYTGYVKGMVDTVLRLDRFGACAYQLGFLYGPQLTQNEIWAIQAHIFKVERKTHKYELTAKFWREVMNARTPEELMRKEGGIAL